LEITDEILDGIFPQEDIKKVTAFQTEDNLNDKFIIDIYGRPQLISDHTTVNKGEEDTNIPRETQKGQTFNSKKLAQIVALILPYANIHISILFILILSLLSLMLTSFNCVISTIVTIFCVVILDIKYKWGIAVDDNNDQDL
jgi:uncharacterized membrane protein